MSRHHLFIFFLLGTIIACTKSVSPTGILAARGGEGDAEAVHGGDPLDLRIQSARALYRRAIGAIRASTNETLGKPLTTCNDFPVRPLCEALNVAPERRAEARQFLLRNREGFANLVDAGNVHFVPTRQTQTQTNADGSERSVMAWTKIAADGIYLYFNDAAGALKDLEFLALLAHEMGHAVVDSQLGRVEDRNGRALLDLVGAELAVFTYEALLKSDPSSLNGLGKGFLSVGEIGRYGGTFADQSYYGDFDGNGRSDLFFVGPDNRVYVSRFNGTRLDAPEAVAKFAGTFEKNRFFFVSLNDDRKTDLLFRDTGNAVTGCLSDGIVFKDCRVLAQLPGDGEIVTGDFNGDRLTDFLYRGRDNRGELYVLAADGRYAKTFSVSFPGEFAGSYVQMADMTSDADGLARTEIIYRNAANTFMRYRPTTGGGLEGPGFVTQHGGNSTEGKAYYADFNADGLVDLMWVGIYSRFWLSVSDGARFITPAKVADLDNDTPEGKLSYFGDFNGDGRADLLYLRTDPGTTTARVLYSTAEGFSEERRVFQLGFEASRGQINVVDLDHDGRADIVVQTLQNIFQLWLSIEGR